MQKILAAFALAILATGLAVAADSSDVMAPIHQFVDGFNHGDVKSAMAACANTTSVIDDFPPHQWHGDGACTAWLNDYMADAKKNGITDGIVTLGKPWHVEVGADSAYVVFPADFTYKKNGKAMKQAGAAFIFTLQKGVSGWDITGWAWGQH